MSSPYSDLRKKAFYYSEKNKFPFFPVDKTEKLWYNTRVSKNWDVAKR